MQKHLFFDANQEERRPTVTQPPGLQRQVNSSAPPWSDPTNRHTTTPQIVFQAPPRRDLISEGLVYSFADDSLNQSDITGYGQTGLITCLDMKLKDGMDLYHALYWISAKQQKVSYNSYCAEILSCADVNKRDYYLQIGLVSMFPNTKVRSELRVDSNCLPYKMERI